MTLRTPCLQASPTITVFSRDQDARPPEAVVLTSRDAQSRTSIEHHEPIPIMQKAPLLYRNSRGKLPQRPSSKASRPLNKFPSTPFSSVSAPHAPTTSTSPACNPQSASVNVLAPRAPSTISRRFSTPRQRPDSRSSPARTVHQYLGYVASNNAALVKDLVQICQWRKPQRALDGNSLAEVFTISQDSKSVEGAVILTDATETARVVRLALEALQDLPRSQATEALQELFPHLLKSIYSDGSSQPECAKPYFSIAVDYHRRLLELEDNRLKLEKCLEETRAELAKQIKEREDDKIANKEEKDLYKSVIDDFFKMKTDCENAELQKLNLEQKLKKTVEKHEEIQKTTIKQQLDEKQAKETKIVQAVYLARQTGSLKAELAKHKEAAIEARKQVTELSQLVKDFQEKERNAFRALEKGEMASSMVELIRQMRPDVYAILTGPMTDEQSSLEYGMVMKIAKACSPQLGEQISFMSPPEATDYFMKYLKNMNQELEGWQLQQSKHKEEIQRLLDLTPHWNKDFFDDVRRVFQDKHHPLASIASHRNTRPFSGLGLEPEVPAFLQVEGFVKHRFVSKVEMEKFMADFWSWRKKKLRADPTFTDFDTQLAAYMEEVFTKHPDERFEFAYALVHSLNTYISDPDFWIFAQIIDKAVPASIVDDQLDMLTHMENLLIECDITPTAEPSRLNRGSKQPPTAEPQEASSNSKRALSKTNIKIINAVLCEMFPAKSAIRLNMLREAIHNSLKTLGGNSILVSELFFENADCSQSRFIEELRKQHCHEIVEFQNAFMTKMRRAHPSRQDIQHAIEAIEEDVEWQKVWLSVIIDRDDVSAQSILKQFQTTRLFRSSSLWVRATRNAVAKALSSSSAVKSLNWPPTSALSATNASEKPKLRLPESDSQFFVTL